MESDRSVLRIGGRPDLINLFWAVVLLVALAGATAYTYFRHRRVLLVVALHNGLWGLALALIGTPLIAYKDASTEAWLTLAAGLIFFNVGAWCATWFSRPPASGEAAPTFTAANAPLMSRPVLLTLTGLYAVAVLWYLVSIAARFGLLALVLDSSAVRGVSGVSYLEAIPFPVRVLLLYLGPLLFVAFGTRWSIAPALPLWLRLTTMAVLAVSMLALLQRANMFMAILWLAAMLLTAASSVTRDPLDAPTGRRRRMTPTQTAVAGIAVLAVVGLVGFLGVGALLKKNGEQAIATGSVSQPLAASGLTDPYVYFTAGVPAFLQLVDSDNHEWPPAHEQVLGSANKVGAYNPQTWGAVTFGPIVRFIPGIPQWPGIVPFVDTGVYTNVFTWLEPFYRDFRWPGVVLGTALLGWITAAAYGRRARSPRMFWIQAALISTIPLATFALKVNTITFLVGVAIVWALTLPWARMALWARNLFTAGSGSARS